MDDEIEIKEQRYASFEKNNVTRKNRIIVAKKDGKVLYTIVDPFNEKKEKE